MSSAQRALVVGALATMLLLGAALGMILSEKGLGLFDQAQTTVVVPPSASATAGSAAQTASGQQSQSAASTPAAAGTGNTNALMPIAGPGWELAARIDAKISNVLIIITITLTILPILIAIFERSKAKDLEEIRNQIKSEQSEFRDKARELINIEVTKEIKRIKDHFSSDIVRDSHFAAIEETEKRLSFIHREDASAERVILSFINSDLRKKLNDAITREDYVRVFELQSALSDLKGADPGLVHTALSHIGGMVEQLSEMTALHLRQHLLLIESDGKVRSISNRGLWHTIVNRIDHKWLAPDESSPGRTAD